MKTQAFVMSRAVGHLFHDLISAAMTPFEGLRHIRSGAEYHHVNALSISRITTKITAFTICSLAIGSLCNIGPLSHKAQAYQGMVLGNNPTPKLHVTGRSLQDPNGKNVTLHGYMQPGASWFNGYGRNYADPTDYTSTSNVAPALNYFKGVADILSNPASRYGQNHGWYCSYVRFIGDGSAPENFAPGWDANGNLANAAQFNGWIQNLLVPYINYCRSRGLYVVILGNPSVAYPGGDHGKNMTQQYQQNLITFWTTLASNPSIKSADNVHFEICNEPIAIESKFGANDWNGGADDAHYQALTNFMQPIVNAIRNQGADNVVWVPCLSWQGDPKGFVKFPVNAGNVGYAVHFYPGYGGVHDNVGAINNLWNSTYKPTADIAPMIITEMYWNPNSGAGYEDLWNASTGGFGSTVRSCIDSQGNVSYNIGMVGDLLGNLDQGLANSTLGTGQGAQAAWSWYSSYSGSNPGAPVGPVDGIYRISPINNTNLAMDVANTSTNDGVLLTQYNWLNANNQKFYLRNLGNNRYWLEPQHALGKCVDVANFNINNGAKVHQWTYFGSLNQQWIVIKQSDGNYRLASALNPTQTLDVPGGTTQASQSLQTYSWWGANSQKWKLTLLSTSSASKTLSTSTTKGSGSSG